MTSFTRDAQGRALLGGVVLADVALDPRVTTPFYAYDVDGVVAAARGLSEGFGTAAHLICYAVKANSAGRLLRALARAGGGADVVSGGELALAIAAGFDPDRIVYSGVAKRDDELDAALAVGAHGVLAVQLESVEEVARVQGRARALGRRGRVSLRVNPGVNPDTHAHVATGHDEAKFGISLAALPEAFAALQRSPSLDTVGVSMHIGSQLADTVEYVRGGRVLAGAARACEQALGVSLAFVDFGGGYGIDYGGTRVTPPADFARSVTALAAELGLAARRILCEPGRALVAAQGVLVARVVQVKRWNNPRSAGWVFVDAGMNDLLRPALYGARHRLEPLTLTPAPQATWRVAGPVCESTDEFGSYELPAEPPQLVVIRDAGAYGYTMAGQYNGRAMPAEVFLEGGSIAAVHRGPNVEAWVADRMST